MQNTKKNQTILTSDLKYFCRYIKYRRSDNIILCTITLIDEFYTRVPNMVKSFKHFFLDLNKLRTI